VQTAQWNEHIGLQATSNIAAVAQADVVLCCIKSTDTEATGDLLRPLIKPGTPVLSLQNGVDNAPRLAAAMGREPSGVVPTVVYVATEMAGPGHVLHHGRGELVVSPFAQSADVAQAFAQAGVPVQVSDNVLGALWAKLPGVAAILGTALMFATGAVLMKRLPVQMPAVPMVAWQIIFGTIPVWFIAIGFETLDLGRVTATGWFCLFYLGLIGQCVAYLAWFQALRRLPAGLAATGNLMVPVIGVLSSGLALGEPLGWRHAIALAMTLGGVAIAARR
jgi:hypothetical protein